MSFVDEAIIKVQAGSGGDGCVSFRREIYVPKGGPNGGNGGRGGDIFLVATLSKRSLLDFKYQPLYRAERGEHGKGKDMDGRGGEDLYIEVPVGTILHRSDTRETVVDLTRNEERVLIAKGGRGGRGNKSFATSVNRAPRQFTRGAQGETAEFLLELRLIADVGLVGFPNAGKSSFLRAVSRAQPKVAAYPFTTLDPNLGVCAHKGKQIVIADLPGLIEGASEGAGLGHKFLRHASRNRSLLHFVDFSLPEEEILSNIRVIREELKAHDPELLKRAEILIFTKADLVAEDDQALKLKSLEEAGEPGRLISSHTGFGIPSLLDSLIEQADTPEVSNSDAQESV